MPRIQSSTDLRNNYNEISTFCHEHREPVFITKNGQGDLAVMSMETYEMLSGKLELYRLLDEGRAAVKARQTRPFEEVFDEIEREIMDGKKTVKNHFDMSYLGVMVDMAGCPNRCRHCWLGSHKNGNMSVDNFRWITEQFKNWRDENGNGISELGFFSWWREPDYRDDYRKLWQLEQQLSSPGRAQRFELLSIWRLARDESYAKWAASLPPKTCQITFFGMEENTDWGTRRKGAFKDNLLATERLIEAGISPRWQLFITKRCLGEMDEFLRLIYELDLHKRCEAIGGKFEVFINGMSPEGNGYDLVDSFIEESDILLIPHGLTDINRDPIDRLGQPEYVLLEALLHEESPANISADIPSISVNADFDVYPNIAEPTEWWRLGNLKTDGVDTIIRHTGMKPRPA